MAFFARQVAGLGATRGWEYQSNHQSARTEGQADPMPRPSPDSRHPPALERYIWLRADSPEAIPHFDTERTTGHVRHVSFILPIPPEELAEDERGLSKSQIAKRAEKRAERQRQKRMHDEAVQKENDLRERLQLVSSAREREAIFSDLAEQMPTTNTLWLKLLEMDNLLWRYEEDRLACLDYDEEHQRQRDAQARGLTRGQYARQRRLDQHEKRLSCRHESGLHFEGGRCLQCPLSNVNHIVVCRECAFSSCWPCLIRADQQICEDSWSSIDTDFESDCSEAHTPEAAGPEDMILTYNDERQRKCWPENVEDLLVTAVFDVPALESEIDGPPESLMFEDDITSSLAAPKNPPHTIRGIQPKSTTTGLINKISVQAALAAETAQTETTSSPVRQACFSQRDHAFVQTCMKTRCQECGCTYEHGGYRCIRCTRTLCLSCKMAKASSPPLSVLESAVFGTSPHAYPFLRSYAFDDYEEGPGILSLDERSQSGPESRCDEGVEIPKARSLPLTSFASSHGAWESRTRAVGNNGVQ